VLNILRLTFGIGLIISLVTACQSNPQSNQTPADQTQSDQTQTNPGQTNPGQTNPGQTNPGQPVPSFNLSLESSSLNLTQGDVTDVKVNLERLNGFTQAVTLNLTGLPADVSASPAVLTIPVAASSTTVRLSASGNASIASSTVTVEGSSGALQKTASLSFATIKPDPNRPDLLIKRIEWGQSVLKSDLRLVPGKSALLLAYINATQAGISGVRVRATVTANGTTLGTLDLTAPAKIPTSDNATDLTSTYWSLLPKDWIRQGLEVKLEVDAGRNLKESNEANNTQILKPTIGMGNKLYLTMVPLIVDGKPAISLTAAAVAEIRTGLMSYWPLADVDIQIRAPYTAKSAGSNWGALLNNDVNVLRDADKSERYYYGFFAAGGGIGYIGYPGGAGDPNSRVMAHEIGHNFRQLHAPCGNPSSVDPNFPYKTGSIGSWGFDANKKTLLDPAKYMDVMGYCGTEWVSDYMYNKVQLFLESNVPSAASVNTTATDLLLVSGTLENGQVHLEPMQRISGVTSATKPGPYGLALETATGPKQVSFDVRHITHTDGNGIIDKAQFSFTMPDPGSISKVTITENNVVKLERSTGGRLSAQSAQATTAQPITVQRNGSSVTVNWDARAYSSVTVAHIAPDGTRTTLALGLTGGTATLELGALGAGQFEVSASDGLNGIKQRF
jgi:Peptidase M66